MRSTFSSLKSALHPTMVTLIGHTTPRKSTQKPIATSPSANVCQREDAVDGTPKKQMVGVADESTPRRKASEAGTPRRCSATSPTQSPQPWSAASCLSPDQKSPSWVRKSSSPADSARGSYTPEKARRGSRIAQRLSETLSALVFAAPTDSEVAGLKAELNDACEHLAALVHDPLKAVTPLSSSAQFEYMLRARQGIEATEKIGAQRLLLSSLLTRCDGTSGWETHAKALLHAAIAELALANAPKAIEHLLSLIDLCAAMSQSESLIHVRHLLAEAMLCASNPTGAREQYELASELIRTRRASEQQISAHPSQNLRGPFNAAEVLFRHAQFLAVKLNDLTAAEALYKEALLFATGKATLQLARGYPAVSHADPRIRAAIQVSLARLYIATGRYEAAQTAFNSLVTQVPDCALPESASGLFEYACFKHHTLGDYDGAASLYEAACAGVKALAMGAAENPLAQAFVHSLYANILFNAGLCYEKSTRHGPHAAAKVLAESLKVFSSLERDPETTRIRLHYARCLCLCDKVDLALEQYSAALAIATKEGSHFTLQVEENARVGTINAAEICGHYAHCLHYFITDFVAAERTYTMALKICSARQMAGVPVRPQTVCWLQEHLAKLFARTGRPHSAANMWSQRIQLGLLHNIASFDARLEHANVLEQIKEYDNAEVCYARLMALPKESLTTHQRLEIVLRYAWLCHYCLQDYVKASELYEIAIKLEPDNPHCLVQLGWCKLQIAGFDLADVAQLYDSAASAVEISKSDPAYENADSVPLRGGRVRMQTRGWDECYVFGECAVFHHDRTHDFEKARRYYLLALSRPRNSSNYAQVAANYAILLHYSLGETEEARRWFSRALEVRPKQYAAASLYVGFLMSQNQTQEALDELQKMAKAFPNEAAAIAHRLAKAKEQLCLPDGAVLQTADAVRAPQQQVSAAPTDDNDPCLALPESYQEILRHYVTALSGSTKALGTAVTRRIIVALLNGAPSAPAAPDLLHLLVKLKLYDVAREGYEAVLAATQNPILVVQYARLLVDHMRKRKKALGVLRSALLRSPNNAIIVDHYADVLASTYPDRKDAAEALHLRCVMDPRHAETPMPWFCFAAFLTYTNPAPRLALKYYLKALEICERQKNPNSGEEMIHNCFASFLDGLIQTGRASDLHLYDPRKPEELRDLMLRHYEIAIKLAPKNPQLRLTYANCLWRLGRTDDAWAAFAEGLAADAQHLTTLRSAAAFVTERCTAAKALGQPVSASVDLTSATALAKQLFLRALQLDPYDVATLSNFAVFTEEIANDPVAAAAIREQCSHLAARSSSAENSLAAGSEDDATSDNDDDDDGDGENSP